MKNYIKYIIYVLPLLLLAACVEEYALEDSPPTEEQAGFSFEPTEQSDNILQFTADNDFFLMNWDMGNGSSATGKSVTGTYPTAGTYTVTLTVFNRGGSVSTSRELVIEETDPLLLDKPLYNNLTGGAQATEGKTWKIDAGRSGHFGVGPNPSSGAGDFPEWYQAQPNEKAGSGMYTDRYTFFLDSFNFTMDTEGLVYLNAAQGGNFPGAYEAEVGDLSAPYSAPEGLKWSMAEPEDGYPELTISQGGFLGYFAGGTTYQVVSISENEMSLRFVDQANTDLAWYIRLIPEGYEPGEEIPDPEPEPVVPGEFSLENLIGDGSKAWKLKPAAGAFGVGPGPGSDEYYPNGTDISGDRPCLFNDLFIFNQDGTYTYDPRGDIFGELYLGVEEEGCQPAANLTGTTGEAWGAGTHEFSFTEGNESSNAKITVTGTGAFIALPKAYNGGEYAGGPPAENSSVTYEVIGYTNEDGIEELTITLDITGSGEIFWSFVLIPDHD
ncbi:PKD domain-containing protein [Algoriphagus sp. NG3]|uniref:PKD domain-containing protein n=1 Tax=unclassified Algoriphagus TaxID=2641541 RepID=UPI002A835FBB|nr:PKD domain-containing protein [Algoriphagus sp. NG3]WPR75938.1 PKD domain-containing protein [Algoriphagus sp. NG3]